MATQTVSPNKIVSTRKFSTKRVEVNQDHLTEKLSNYYREYLIGTDPDPVTLAIFLTMEHGKIAETVISKMFGVPLEAAGNAGYDIDTTNVELDEVCYGKVEIRARSLLQNKRPNGYETRYFPFINYGDDMRRKYEGCANYFFLCGWDPEEDQPVWFRVPRKDALSSTALTIQKSKRDGQWGWATKYVWSGPA